MSRRKMNQFNALNVDEPTYPPREWNIQPPEYYFKSMTSPPKNSPVVSAIMVRLNHHSIDNGDVEVHPSGFPFVSNSESVIYLDTTPIKSIDYYEMYHLFELFHSIHK